MKETEEVTRKWKDILCSWIRVNIVKIALRLKAILKVSSMVTLLLLLLLLLSRFSRVRFCAPPEMAAHQAPPSLGFSRQEHWSRLSFFSPMHESKK